MTVIVDYYARDGSPITDLMEWSKLLGDKEYRCVAETTLPNGKWISTVWLGLNHNYDSGKPLIFETMVFESKENLSGELDCLRYATEAEALKGHKRVVEEWGSK